MGVTAVDVQILESLIRKYMPRKVLDFGAQNNFAQPLLPAPYMSEWWKAKGIEYDSIDLTAENGCTVKDLSQVFTAMDSVPKYDFVMDFGTSEHISDDGNSYGTGKFSWQHIYNCWLNKHNLLHIGGIMVNENPKTGNWPGHGFNYYTQEFYFRLVKLAGYQIEIIQGIPAMGNVTDGWNILCVLRKFSNKFPSLEDFKTLDLRTS